MCTMLDTSVGPTHVMMHADDCVAVRDNTGAGW
jgi:hypothetical protein